MSIREEFPGSRGGDGTQDVAALLAGVVFPSIEPFGTDNEALAGLPLFTSFPVPDPEPASVAGVARDVYDQGMAALGAVKVLEDALSACKASLVARVMGAATVEAGAVSLDAWQRNVMEASAVTHLSMMLGVPEPTAARLAHHSTELVANHPKVLAGVHEGAYSFRHATVMIDELTTLDDHGAITAKERAVFEEKLLGLAPGTTAASFTGKARRARERMFPGSIATKVKEAFRKRAMFCEVDKDGMSWLTLYLPTLAAEGIYTRCTRMGRAMKAAAGKAQRAADAAGTGEDCLDYRTLAQLRADIAAALLLGQQTTTTNSTTSKTNDTGAGNDPTSGGGSGFAPSGSANTGGHSRFAGSDSRSRSGAAAGTGADAGSAADSGNGSGQSSGGSWFEWVESETEKAQQAKSGSGYDGVKVIAEEPPWTHTSPTTPAATEPLAETSGTSETSEGEATTPPETSAKRTILSDPAADVAEAGVESGVQGTALPGAAGEAVLVGELVGDGSGFVNHVVDGVKENPQQEYMAQTEALARSKVVADPPLPKALVLITVPVLGLLGITDEPAEMAGPLGGPVPEDIARKLLAGSSTFLRVLTDPISGEALPAQPERYTLKEAEKAVLQTLAGHCYVPNCPNPVIDTDLDHLEAFEFGGESTMVNLRPACKRHHGMKHFKDDKNRYGQRRCINEPERNSLRLRGWTPKPTIDGRIGWITPSGTYREPPAEEAPRPRYPKWLKKLISPQPKKP